jgi:hypothetical protein
VADTFYRYQERRLGILWRWGVASALAGLPGLFLRHPLLRHVAIQTSSWGVIDALLAFFGRRAARRKERLLAAGALSLADQRREARRFRAILLVNALLDICYIAGGVILARHHRPDRRGMGLGIIPQGLFLLLFDGLLARGVGRWLHKAAD